MEAATVLGYPAAKTAARSLYEALPSLTCDVSLVLGMKEGKIG